MVGRPRQSAQGRCRIITGRRCDKTSRVFVRQILPIKANDARYCRVSRHQTAPLLRCATAREGPWNADPPAVFHYVDNLARWWLPHTFECNRRRQKLQCAQKSAATLPDTISLCRCETITIRQIGSQFHASVGGIYSKPHRRLVVR